MFLNEAQLIALGLVVAASLVLMLTRPHGIGEVWWVGLGVAGLLLARLLPWQVAGRAVLQGTDVYLFLVGMMLLAELAREQGVFDWLAAAAVAHSHGSQGRLFLLVYAAGAGVTAVLSNDATAVVLTPAVLAAVQRAGPDVDAAPFLFVCAMIANAGSFILPMANLGNLVVFGGHMPGLLQWLRLFLLPSIGAIVVTYGVLRWWFRAPLRGALRPSKSRPRLSRPGMIVLVGIGCLAVVLLTASALGWQLGLPTLLATLLLIAVVSAVSHEGVWPSASRIAHGVSWSVVLLTMELFCLVAAVERAGLLTAVAGLLVRAQSLPRGEGVLGTGLALALLDNVTNNLPSGLLAGHAVQKAGLHGPIAAAVLIGTDLGPNLSAIGSLSTLLWLIRVRQVGIQVSKKNFLKVGSLAMPLAITVALIMLCAEQQ